MFVNAKKIVRKVLSNLGYEIVAQPSHLPAFHSLEADLPRLVRNPTPLVIDVGANKGQTIEMMRRAFAKPRIFSFEPNPELATELRSKFARLGVTIEQVAVGAGNGEVQFKIYNSDRLSSVLDVVREENSPFKDVGLKEMREVTMVMLDTYAQRQRIDYIDLLYTDAQGLDLEILRGASELLDRHAIDTILADVYFDRYYEKQGDFGEIQHFLAAKGYGLVNLYQPVRQHHCIRFAIGCFQRTKH